MFDWSTANEPRVDTQEDILRASREFAASHARHAMRASRMGIQAFQESRAARHGMTAAEFTEAKAKARQEFAAAKRRGAISFYRDKTGLQVETYRAGPDKDLLVTRHPDGRTDVQRLDVASKTGEKQAMAAKGFFAHLGAGLDLAVAKGVEHTGAQVRKAMRRIHEDLTHVHF